jgi:hypothetical protein
MKRAAWWAGGLALLVALPSLVNGFVYDDVPAIVANPIVTAGHFLGIWTSPYWPLGLLYRPLTVQLFALEWQAGGGSPLPFHLVNALLYVAVTVLVARIARRWLPSAGALIAGLGFAVHPAHVEVVANGVGQSELLAALFVLIAVDRYLAWRDDPAGFTASRRGALAACYVLAIAAKETGYVLPVLLLGIALLDGGPGAARRRVRPAGSLLLLLGCVAIAGLLLRVILFGGLAGESPQVPLRGLGLLARVAAMLAVIPHWTRLFLFPVHLQAHYGPPAIPVSASLDALHLLGLALLLLFLVLLGWTARRARPVAIGLAWMAIGLLPVSNLLTATGVLLAERTLFLPSVGLAIILGWIATEAVQRVRSPAGLRLAQVVLVAVLGAAGGRFIARSPVWHDQDGFFAALERDAPGSYRAQLTAGVYYKGARRFEDAERALHRAWSLYRGDPAVFEEYGQLYRIQGRCDRGLPIFAEGVERHPDETVVRARLIECALALGDTNRARQVAREGVQRGRSEFEGTLKRLGGN